LDVVNGRAYNTILSINELRWNVDILEQLPEGTQPQVTTEELLACEQAVRKDARVQKLAKDVGEPFSFQ
jgi:primary-amine oxidase